jgi:hypothetical protein
MNQEAHETIGHLLNQTAQGKWIPFFGINQESWQHDYSTWSNYFYPAQTLQGREKYYWTIIT